MSTLAIDVDRLPRLILEILHPDLEGDIVGPRVLGLFKACTEVIPISSMERLWPHMKTNIDLLDKVARPLDQHKNALASILYCIKHHAQIAPAEMSFLFALGEHFADKFEASKQIIEDDDLDLLLDFDSCKDLWISARSPFTPSIENALEWEPKALITFLSCLRYFPSAPIIHQLIDELSEPTCEVLDKNGMLSALMRQQAFSSEEFNEYLFDVLKSLRERFPVSFESVRDLLFFSHTTPFLHQIYSRLYVLSTIDAAISTEDVILCRQYLDKLPENTLQVVESHFLRSLFEKFSLQQRDLIELVPMVYRDQLIGQIDLACASSANPNISDERVQVFNALQKMLLQMPPDEAQQIRAALPAFLIEFMDDRALSMVMHPKTALSCLEVVDFFSVGITAHSTQQIFLRTIVTDREEQQLIFCRMLQESVPSMQEGSVQSISLQTPSGQRIYYSTFVNDPLFMKLKNKESIFQAIQHVLQTEHFLTAYAKFLSELTTPRWYLFCEEDYLLCSHLATIAFYDKKISEEELFIIHRVCETYRDDTVVAHCKILDSSNVEQYLQERNYPPYAYQKSSARHKDFRDFLASFQYRSYVERTSIDYRLIHFSEKNVERYVLEKGGYKEATVMKREDGVEFIFHTLLPPSVNLDLYNIHLEQEQKRTMNDYVWGFGFSEDYTPFFVGKRPISIASVYHGMEDLSSFKIHGFTQRDAKSLGLDFHDCAYHIPIEMNIQRGELSFLGFVAEAVHTFSQKLFHVFQDPIQKSRYQKIFSTYLDAIADREIFVASAGGRLLDKRVDLKHLSQKVNRHPLVKNAKETVPRIDRLVVSFHHLPRNLTVDPSRFFAKATEMHPTQGAPSVAFHFGFIPK